MADQTDTERLCAHCGDPLAETAKASARFCSRTCKTNDANLEAARGKQLYRLAYRWRKGYGKDEVSRISLSNLSWLMDQFIREDREAGRPPPPPGPTDMAVDHSYMTRHKKLEAVV